jgi:flagellar assembly factor FliW
MKLQTKVLGEITIDDRQIISFPEGIIGFEKFTDYALLDAPQPPYFFLQSTVATDLCFILLDPFLFRPDYSIDLSDESVKKLDINSPDDALVFSIVTVPLDGSSITANLMGPLVIGRKSRKGIQFIVPDSQWLTKHDVMAELAASRK